MTHIGQSSPGSRLPLPHRGGAITLAWGAATDVGHRRQVNEDSFVAEPPIFAVADGMGGHAAGDLASEAVVNRLGGVIADGFVTPAAIGLALAQASHDIAQLDGTALVGAGTTVTGMALTMSGDDPYFAVFNVGDSRVYRYLEGEFEQVTVDHSVVQELVDAGAITRRQADNHPDSNVITRAIGFNEPPMPDYWMLPVEPGLRLLACSDGLSKELDDERIESLLAAGAPAADTATALVQAALESGGRDNVTVVLVDVLAVETN
ncbi:MAG TPA: protein phosphatase 2C domain-containing protein [Amnibacterium sp.]|uniref:PP2C family protein-serine/threonine phosphatase n=1 Tax=Amnibacterium sp. TaxID=1872496 RepID=UPI002F95CEA0